MSLFHVKSISAVWRQPYVLFGVHIVFPNLYSVTFPVQNTFLKNSCTSTNIKWELKKDKKVVWTTLLIIVWLELQVWNDMSATYDLSLILWACLQITMSANACSLRSCDLDWHSCQHHCQKCTHRGTSKLIRLLWSASWRLWSQKAVLCLLPL